MGIGFTKADRARRSFSKCFKRLAELNHLLFLTAMENQAKNHSSEKKLQKKRVALWNAIAHARPFKKSGKKIFSKIEHCVEIIFSMDQLRFRVADPSIFKICALEWSNLDRAIAGSFQYCAQQCFLFSQIGPFDFLLEAIQQFENIYNRALSVVVEGPIVFLFFIQDLYALYDECVGAQNENV